MGNRRRKYSREFKVEAVRSWRVSGETSEVYAEQLGIAPSMLRKWAVNLEEDGVEAFPGQGKQKPSDAEVTKLRKELRDTKLQLEILKKALSIVSDPK